MLLVEWMGPKLRFSGKSGIFVNLERWEEERMRFGGSITWGQYWYGDYVNTSA
jgi:hypothetical protein